jgi:hypothetical protein
VEDMPQNTVQTMMLSGVFVSRKKFSKIFIFSLAIYLRNDYIRNCDGFLKDGKVVKAEKKLKKIKFFG